jgi:hypothetical protein
VHFDLYLEGKYPFQSPKLFCETVSGFPSVADGRDLIEELLSTRWSPSITCADIVGQIPKFYQESILKNQPELFNKNYGKFHLGSPYLLDLWYGKELMSYFYCTENDLNNTRYMKERMIVVTHTLILIFELNTQIIDVGYLISWATLQSLNSIKRAINESDRLTFEWKKIGENPAFCQQFKVPQANQLIDLISANIKRINKLNQELSEKKVFKEEEMTGKTIKNMKIGEILEEINLIERHLEQNLSLNIVNHLMELYQHVIEYFTAFGDMQFQVYLEKMHKLLLNERVSAVLQGKNVEGSQKISNLKDSEIYTQISSVSLPEGAKEEEKVEKEKNFVEDEFCEELSYTLPQDPELEISSDSDDVKDESIEKNFQGFEESAYSSGSIEPAISEGLNKGQDVKGLNEEVLKTSQKPKNLSIDEKFAIDDDF